MKKFKKAVSILLSVTMISGMLAVLPVTADAAQKPEVSYTKYRFNGFVGFAEPTTYNTRDYTVVTKDLMTNSSGGTGKGLTSGTYVVTSNTTVDERVEIVKGAEVDLVIQPDVTLTCSKGIGCGYNKKGEYATLNICGSGKLVATGSDKTAGIGGGDDETSGDILVHGCTVEATGGKHGAGIGGGEGGRDPDDKTSIKIFAGDITATGGVDGAGIGGGDEQQGAKTYIYGGKIDASSEKHGAGIGGGDEENTRGIYIYGGKTEATGGDHGAGEHGGNIHEIKITGGEIEARGGSGGAGIGGGFDEDMSGEIDISDDVKLTAIAGEGGAGIGAGAGAEWYPDGDMDGTIRINGGSGSDIRVYGLSKKLHNYGTAMFTSTYDKEFRGYNGAGIGAGYGGNMGGKVYLTGGNMWIWSGVGGAGIGGGCENWKTGGEGGDVYIGGGNINVYAIIYSAGGSNTFGYKTHNSAIGAGDNDYKEGSVYIHPDNNTTGKYMKVIREPLGDYMDDFKPEVTEIAADRSKKCHTKSWLTISECDHKDHNGNSGLSYTIEGDKHRVKCKYCGYNALEEHDGSIPCGKCGYKSDVEQHSVTIMTKYGDPVQLDAEMQFVAHGKSFTLPECDKIPKGKRFVEWILGSGAPKNPGDDIIINADTTVEAYYADLLSITYDHQIPNDNWISLNKTAADVDDEIIVTAHPYGGYRMKTVIVRKNDENGEILNEIEVEQGKNTCSFTMPALRNIYVTAKFEEAGYFVDISEAENGTVTAEPPSIAYTAFDNGATPTVTLTATPEEGYHLSKLLCKTESGNIIEYSPTGEPNGYTFAMLQENVKVSAEFEKDSIFNGHSLTLNGDIGVNFYLNLTVEQAAKTTVSFTWNRDGEVQTASADLSQAEHYDCGYKATCNVSAPEMRTDITATVTIDGEPVEETNTYSVAQYVDVILTNADFADYYVSYENDKGNDGQQKLAQLRTLAEKMLVYGDNAKVYFNKKASALEGEDAPAANIPESNAVITGLPEDMFVGAKLSLDSETTLSLFFKSADALDLTCVGRDAETASRYDEYVIRIRNIPAYELDEPVTVTVNGTGTVTYSPLTYCYKAQTAISAKLVNTVKALYNYHLAAKEYF